MSRQSEQNPPGRGTDTTGRRPPSDDVAHIRQISVDKPRHGKKRRASRKRHEVSVVKELHLHPEEEPQEAARVVRQAKPPAKVIDVTEGIRKRANRVAGDESQQKAPAPEGLREQLLGYYAKGRARVLGGLARLLEKAAHLASVPVEVIRTIRELRESEP